MKEIYFIFFINGEDYYSITFADLKNNQNVYLCGEVFLPKVSMWKRIVRHFHVSYILNRFIKIPGKVIWYPRLPEYHPGNEYIIVFLQTFRGAYDIYFSEYLKKKYHNPKRVLFLTNPLSKAIFPISRETMKESFDLIFSDDLLDCKKYGLLYREDTYARIEIETSEKIFSDVFFCGTSKGRLQILHDVYEKLIQNGFRPMFYITDVDDSEKRYPDIHYNERLPYTEVLKRVAGCDTLLEIVQDGQLGLTLRTQEALTYGKKLLTNNSFIKQKPYYTPENIAVFTTSDEINISWLKKEHFADYTNVPDFSANSLIAFLTNYFSSTFNK